MKTKIILLIALACLPIHHAFAGDKVGNGGDAIVCRNASGAISSVQLLDYYEARGSAPINLGNGTWQERVENMLGRLEKVGPVRTRLYRTWWREFKESEATFVENVSLPEIDDHGFVLTPHGCELKQIAVQLLEEDLFAGTKRYVIRADLWAYLSADDKAGLVLHELIYRETKKYVNNSITTRSFNALLAQGLLDSEQYIKMIERIKLPMVEVHGIPLSTGMLSRDQNGRITFGPISNIYDVSGLIVSTPLTDCELSKEQYGFVRFTELGKISAARLNCHNFHLNISKNSTQINIKPSSTQRSEFIFKTERNLSGLETQSFSISDAYLEYTTPDFSLAGYIPAGRDVTFSLDTLLMNKVASFGDPNGNEVMQNSFWVMVDQEKITGIKAVHIGKDGMPFYVKTANNEQYLWFWPAKRWVKGAANVEFSILGAALLEGQDAYSVHKVESLTNSIPLLVSGKNVLCNSWTREWSGSFNAKCNGMMDLVVLNDDGESVTLKLNLAKEFQVTTNDSRTEHEVHKAWLTNSVTKKSGFFNSKQCNEGSITLKKNAAGKLAIDWCESER